MFAHDWPVEDDHDDHLPLEERGWVRRLQEQKAARERFDRECPDFFERMGRAVAEHMQEIAIQILTGEGKTDGY